MSNVMSASTILVSGGMMTNLMLKTTDNGTNFAQFSVSANNGVNVWVSIYEEEMYNFLSRNARKGTQVEITGKLKRAVIKDGSAVMNITAYDVRLVANFGSEFVQKQDETHREGATA